MCKRLLALLLTLCLVVGLFPTVTLAAETKEFEMITKTFVNPVYAGMIDEEDLPQSTRVLPPANGVYYNNVEDAALYMRQCMMQRQESIQIGYRTSNPDGALLDDVINAAVVHTGNPTEGDYLAWQYGGCTAGMSGKSDGGDYLLTLSFNVVYYDNAAQEAEVDSAVAKLLAELNVASLTTDYAKLKAVYDWMCDNITYDYENLNNDAYLLKCTAYAALINRTAVCQGYANLLYRLALEMGIDCRIIVGTGNGGGHAWNIIKLDGKYYNLDATWDINYRQNDNYEYFLRCEANFGDHQRDPEYVTSEFHAAYPMSSTDYDPSNAGTQEPTEPEPTEPPAPTEPEPTEPEPTDPAPVTGLTHSGDLNAAKPSKEQIQAKYQSITAATEVFKEKPSTTAPYTAGSLSDSFLANGLTFLNYVRYVAGLPAVQLDATLNDYAQHGAVVMAANNELSHYPAQPADMDAAFYEKGYAATTTSNIGYGYRSLSDMIDGCLDDSDSYNMDRLGHRRWLLNPTLLYVGMGYAEAANGARYSTTRVFDRSGADVDYDFISWPASGYCPEDLFGANVPWSITVNTQKYKTPTMNQVKITLTRQSDGMQWNLDGSTGSPNTSGAPFLTIDTAGYGVRNCIIFHPGYGKMGPCEGTFTVEVSGLYDWNDSPVTIRYQVEFFDASACLEHSFMEEVIPPTCVDEGYTWFTCTRCGHSFSADYVDATGHTPVTDPAVPATCTQNGLSEGSHCGVCGTVLVKQETVSGSHSYEAVVTAPTCTSQGYTTYTCSICGSSYVGDHTQIATHTPVTDPAIPATCTQNGLTEGSHCGVCGTVLVKQETVSGSHSYDSVVTAPTCEDQGCTTHTCTVCGDSYVDSYVDATGHQLQTTHTEATCTTPGSSSSSCKVCTYTSVSYKPALGHVYGYIVTPPTYTEQGYTTYTCSRCGDSYVDDYTGPLSHDPVTDPAVPATCTESGLTEGSHCADCGEVLVKQEVVPATGHHYEAVVTEPTCTAGGYTTHTCAVCGDSYVDSETEAKGHTFGDWYTATAATCTAEGTARRDCGCGHSETKSVPALGHSYESAVTAPTCTEQGYTTHTCTACGDSFVDSYVDVISHSYTDAADTTCNNCGLEREPEQNSMLGDVDGSGSVDFFDGMIVLQYYAGLINETALDVSAADVDNSGSIDFFDGMYILQFYAGILEALPVE